MGISLSSALEESKSKSNVNTICELHSLERKVLCKLEEQASKLYIKALHDECLPIACAVDKTQKISLKVDSASRDEVRKRINQVLHGNYLEELVKLLTEKMNNVLETTVMGDEERSFTHVVFANKSILRVDLFVYYRSFTPSEGLREYKNILAYFIQVGLLDVTKARPQVLIYELTRATEEDKVNDACEKLEARAKCTERLNYALQYTGKVLRETSKTDQPREGFWVPIARTGRETCPVKAQEEKLPLFRAIAAPSSSSKVRRQSISYTRARELLKEAFDGIIGWQYGTVLQRPCSR